MPFVPCNDIYRKCALLFQINRANKFYVRSFVFMERSGATKKPFQNSDLFEPGEREQEKEREQEGGEIVIDRNVKFSIEIGACAWFWFRFRFRGPVRPFDIVLMHTQNNQRKCEGELRIISMLLIGDWVTVLFFAAAFFSSVYLNCRKRKPSSAFNQDGGEKTRICALFGTGSFFARREKRINEKNKKNKRLE